MPDPEFIELTRAAHTDAAMILYGLELRAIRARLAPGDRGRKIVLIHPDDTDRAHKAMPLIWDAALGDNGRAENADGGCPWCNYDLSGTPRTPGTPCPECGADLTSIEARLRARDGRKRRG